MSKNDQRTRQILERAFARIDSIALGVASGIVLGTFIFIATNILVLRGGDLVGPNLSLLSQYFIGYTVTFIGSIVGFLYGFLSGMAFGWLTGTLHNLAFHVYIIIARFKLNLASMSDIIDRDHTRLD